MHNSKGFSLIAKAIRTVYKGGALIQSEVAVKVIDKFSQLANETVDKNKDKRGELLTEREIEILRLIAEGKIIKKFATKYPIFLIIDPHPTLIMGENYPIEVYSLCILHAHCVHSVYTV